MAQLIHTNTYKVAEEREKIERNEQTERTNRMKEYARQTFMVEYYSEGIRSFADMNNKIEHWFAQCTKMYVVEQWRSGKGEAGVRCMVRCI